MPQPTNCLSVLDHFVVLALKRLIKSSKNSKHTEMILKDPLKHVNEMILSIDSPTHSLNKTTH